MQLVEVILQGVRGAQRPARWTLPTAKGVSIVPAGDAETLFARAVHELLAVDSDGDLPRHVLPEAEGQARAALVVVGRDGKRYRLLWDLGTGRRALQSETVTDGKPGWQVVTTTANEIASSITAQLGFPSADALRDIFIVTVDDLPSRRTTSSTTSSSKAASARADKPLPPGFGDAPAAKRDADKPLPPGFDLDAMTAPRSRFVGRPEHELRERLEEIQRRTASTVDVGALEFELDGLQKKTFELQARRKPVADAEQALRTIDEQLAKLAWVERLPPDFLERARRLGTIRAEHDREIQRLDDATKAIVDSASHLSEEVSGLTRRGGPRPLQAALDDPFVRWGSVAGVAAIVVGGLGHFAVDGLRWLALVDIPAFGVAVYGGIRLLSGLEEGASVRLKLTRYADERKRQHERFAIDREQIERLLEKNQLTLEQIPELEQGFALRNDLVERRAAHAAVLEQQRGDELTTIDAELAATADRIRTLESELQNAGSGYDPATADLKREADEIEAVLRGEITDSSADASSSSSALSASSGPSAAALAMANEDSSPPTPVGGTAVDVLRRQLRQASDLLVLSIDDTAQKLAPRAGQMIQALTDQRWVGVSFTHTGDASVVDGVARQPMPYVQLPPGDRDLVAFGFQLAIVEAVSAAGNPMPLVLDRVLDTWPADKAPLLVRALQFAGNGTQVICLTQRRELAAAGAVVTVQQAPA